MPTFFRTALSAALVVWPLTTPCVLTAQSQPPRAAPPVGYTPAQCSNCAEWNAPHAPVRLFGNAYWVGTDGLGAILITSGEGHILIDGALPESAPLIEANVRALGYRMTDIKVIVNSHAHFDHAGGIAALQRASGAKVAATQASARVLRTGKPAPNDPQIHDALPFPTVAAVEIVRDGDTLRVGSLAIVAHITPGHSPGGTTWSWRSCEGNRCVDMVYADSQTPVSSDGFRFSNGNAVAEFEKGLAVIAGMRCDLLVTPHPAASQLWPRVAARDAGNDNALIDPDGCVQYAGRSREQLAKRLAQERR